MEIKYSIVITAYNRAWCIERAISSAHQFLIMADWCGEIIIVDDGSTDETANIVKNIINSFAKFHINHISLIILPENKGVCAAKNAGANLARGQWTIFLDSDDELIFENYEKINKALENLDHYPVHFFSTTIGSEIQKEVINRVSFLDINTLVLNGTGGRDAVPVIKSNVKKLFQYDEDIQGYEGLAYMRLAKTFEKLALHSTPLITVHTSHLDRLSSKTGQKKRFKDLARGHSRALHEHWTVFSMESRVKMVLRYVKTIMLSIKIGSK